MLGGRLFVTRAAVSRGAEARKPSSRTWIWAWVLRLYIVDNAHETCARRTTEPKINLSCALSTQAASAASSSQWSSLRLPNIPSILRLPPLSRAFSSSCHPYERAPGRANCDSHSQHEGGGIPSQFLHPPRPPQPPEPPMYYYEGVCGRERENAARIDRHFTRLVQSSCGDLVMLRSQWSQLQSPPFPSPRSNDVCLRHQAIVTNAGILVRWTLRDSKQQLPPLPIPEVLRGECGETNRDFTRSPSVILMYSHLWLCPVGIS